MSKPWFRMYAEFASDPKMQLLAFEDQRHFMVLLCLKCNGTLDSGAPSPEFRERMIAKALGLDVVTALEVRRRLMEVGVIGNDWQPVKWDDRQYDSDSSTERTRAWRERKRGGDNSKRHSDVTVTDEIRTEQNRKEHVELPPAPQPNGRHAAIPTDVTTVFNHWRVTWGHEKAKLDLKRDKAIRRALKDYDVTQLCQSITGYRNSPHHRGENERNTPYDDVELFLRDAKHIEAGIQLAAKGQERQWT